MSRRTLLRRYIFCGLPRVRGKVSASVFRLSLGMCRPLHLTSSELGALCRGQFAVEQSYTNYVEMLM